MTVFAVTIPSGGTAAPYDDGKPLTIEFDCMKTEGPGAAFVFAGTRRDPHSWIAPHKVAAVCRALYEAAGLPVPDLPDIPDPELVEALGNDLARFDRDTTSCAAFARELLARGWGRTA